MAVARVAPPKKYVHERTMTTTPESDRNTDKGPESQPQSQSLPGVTDTFGLTPRPHSKSKARLVDPLLGADLGGVTIIRLLGEGGMGRVYEARQEKPARAVAVKVIRQGITSEKTLRRFEREAEFLAKLQHPGIAQIFLVGSYTSDYGDVPFYAMEFIADAKPITLYCFETPVPLSQRLRLFADVCDAVAHGHHRGIVHRDLKPGNILIDGTGKPRVIDFGVARSTDSDLTLTSMKTDSGNLVGTAQYMSPEQFGANPDDLDPRTDVYSLGVVLYELLSGVLPYEFRRKGIHEIARLVCEQPPAPLRLYGENIPRDAVAIVEKCLEKNRRDRYHSAGDLAADIRRYLNGQPVQAGKGRIFGLRWLRSLAPGSRAGKALLLLLVTGSIAALVTTAGWRMQSATLVDPRPSVTLPISDAVVKPVVEIPAPPPGPVTKEILVTGSWADTGFVIEKDRCYRLTLTGMSRDRAGKEFGPDGTCPVMLRTVLGPLNELPPKTRSQGYVGQHPIRAVIGRIADKSWSIHIGPNLTFIAPASGPLSLQINEPKGSKLNPEGVLECTFEVVPEPRFVDAAGRTTIWAHIDDRDTLLISPKGLQWEYGGNWARVGMHDGVFPTLVNGIAWWPDWTDPITSSVLTTDDFAGVAEAISRGGRGVRVIDVTALHGRVQVEKPDGESARVVFQDLVLGSGDIGCTLEVAKPGKVSAR